MNQFDKFIEETDNELNVDTSSRKFSIGSKNKENRAKRESDGPISVSSLSPQSNPRNSIISTSSNGKPFNIQRQLIPIRVHDLNDQPLKSPEQEDPIKQNNMTSPQLRHPQGISRNRSTSRSMINKRRSLIQPIIPHSEHPNSGTHKHNTSASNIHHIANKSLEQNVIAENPMLSLTDSNVSHSSIEETTNRSSIIVETNDVHELLKNLANKELELFESKQKIEELKKNLIYHEKLYEQQSNDLKQLKSKVSKHLSDKSATINVTTPMKKNETDPQATQPSIQNQSTPETPKYIEKTLAPTQHNKSSLSPLRLGKRTTPSKTNKFIKQDTIIEDRPYIDTEPHVAAVKLNPTGYEVPSPLQQQSSSNGSVWSKPFSIFNQFDQILQNELEKSLNWDNDTENETSFVEEDEEDDTNQPLPFQVSNRKIQPTQPLPNIQRELTPTNPRSMYNNNNNNSQMTRNVSNNSNSTLTRSVSTSLWGFVNDMKEGLLGTYEVYDNDSQRATDSPDLHSSSMKEFNTTKKVDDGPRLRKRGGNGNNSSVSIDEINRSVEMSYI